MQVEVLENEVDALAREVMRLRLMVHRVTQVLQWQAMSPDKETNRINKEENNNKQNSIVHKLDQCKGEEPRRELQPQWESALYESNFNHVDNGALIDIIQHMEKEIKELKRHDYHRRKAQHRRHHRHCDAVTRQQQQQEEEQQERAEKQSEERRQYNSKHTVQVEKLHLQEEENAHNAINNKSMSKIQKDIEKVNDREQLQLKKEIRKRKRRNKLQNKFNDNNNSSNANIIDSNANNINKELIRSSQSQKLIKQVAPVNSNIANTQVNKSFDSQCNDSDLHEKDKTNNTEIFIPIEESKSAPDRYKHLTSTKDDICFENNINNINNNSINSVNKYMYSSEITNSRLNNTNTNASDVDSVKLEEFDETSTNSVNDTITPFVATGATSKANAMMKNSSSNENLAISPIVQALRAQAQKEKEKRQMQNTSRDTASSSDDNTLNNMMHSTHEQGQSTHVVQTASATNTLHKHQKQKLHTSNRNNLEISSSSSSSSTSSSSSSPEVLAKLALQASLQGTRKKHSELQHTELQKATSTDSMMKTVNDLQPVNKELIASDKQLGNSDNSVLSLLHKQTEEHLQQKEPSTNGGKSEEVKLDQSHSQSSIKLVSFKPNQMVASMRNNSSASRSALAMANSRTTHIDKSILSELRLQIAESSDSSSSSSNPSSESREHNHKKMENKLKNYEMHKSSSGNDDMQGNSKSQLVSVTNNKNINSKKIIKEDVQTHRKLMKLDDKNTQSKNANAPRSVDNVAHYSDNSHASRVSSSSSSSTSSSKLSWRNIEFNEHAKEKVEQTKAPITVTINTTDATNTVEEEVDKVQSSAYQPMTLATAKLLYGNALDSIQNTPTLLTNDESTPALENEMMSVFNTPATNNITGPVQNFATVQASLSPGNEKLSLSLKSKTLQSSFGGYDYNLGLDSSRSFFTPSF